MQQQLKSWQQAGNSSTSRYSQQVKAARDMIEPMYNKAMENVKDNVAEFSEQLSERLRSTATHDDAETENEEK